MRIAVAIPCYNEARRLDLDALARYAADAPVADLLFVDDGSTDGTWERLQDAVALAPDRFAALRLPRNAGKAEAVRRGLLALLDAGYDVVGFWDADLATPLAALPSFVEVLRSRPDLEWVIGSRVRLLGRHIERRATRHYFGRIFATLASLSLNLPVYDTQCGAKLFRKTSGLQRLLAQPFVSRWIFDVELIRRLSLLDGPDRRDPALIIYELPLVEWRDVGGSKVRAKDFVVAALELGRIRFGYQTPPPLPGPP